MPSLLPLLLVVSMLAPALAAAAPTPEARCEAERLRDLARGVGARIACESSAARKGIDPEPACTDEARSTLLADLEAAEAAFECLGEGQGSAIADASDSLAADLVALLRDTAGPHPCAGAKMKVASRRVQSGLKCLVRAARAGAEPDPACIDKAAATLVARIARLESGASCLVVGHAAPLETLVGEFVAYSLAILRGQDPGQRPAALAAMAADLEVSLSWTAADPSSGRTRARLLRRLDVPPSGPTDAEAEVVYEGEAESTTDPLASLLPSTSMDARTYHYAVFGCTEGWVCETTGSRTSFSPTLVQVLRAGGYVLHWRHASANVCADRTDLGTAATTMVPDWWKSCDSDCMTATARQLNTAGRDESVAIGEAFDARGIPVGRVVSSEFCRNVETAALMDFGPAIEEVPELTYFVHDEASRCADTFAMLAEPPAAGTNTALVGHSGNTCPPLSNLAWAEAAVYRPDGVGGALLVARVTAAEWGTLP